jgi:hypothetical protein
VTSPLREELLSIKRGELTLEQVRARAEDKAAHLEEARRSSVLPERADVTRIDGLLKRIRHEAAQRFLDRVPGVFGNDAPEAPPAQWSAPP